MTGMKKGLLALALVCGALPAAALAQSPYGYFGYGWVDSYGQGQVVSYNDNIPYFAAHPPVYYSHEIVRRPMGPSPFAFPGYHMPMMQAEVAIAPAMVAAPKKMEPVMINNSYYVQKQAPSAATVSYVQPLTREAASRGTQMIVNPFVKR
jgi:hypothetical protein